MKTGHDVVATNDPTVMTADEVTTTPTDEIDSGPGLIASSRSALARLTVPEQLLLAAAGLSTIARASFTTYPTALRIALFALIGLPGLAALIRATRVNQAARWSTAFLVAALLSTAMAPNVLFAFKGDVTGTPSWLFLALGIGWWAIGGTLSPGARRLLPWVLVAGFSVNAVIGVLQVVFDIQTGALATFSGRASGLMDNPVYFGTLGAGLSAWSLVRASDGDGRRWFALTFGLAFATGMSGSRVATLVVVVTAIVVLSVVRTRRTAAHGVLAAVAVTVASAFTGAFTQTSTAARLSTGEGPGQRLEIWRYGLSAFLDRPLLGWGPGHYGYATWPHYTFEFVRDSAWVDELQPWTYPHNLAVMLLTTTGVIGVALFGAFVVSNLRQTVDVPMAALAVGAAATYGLQPATVQTWPLVLLALGAATATRAHPDSASPRWLTSAAFAVGALLATYVLVADYRIGAASERGDLEALESTAAWFPRDAAVAGFVANQMELAGVAFAPDRFDDAVRWSQRSLDWAPESPMAHNEVAIRQYLAGDLDAMKASIDRAIEIQEWNPSARRLLVVYALATDDVEATEAAVADACALELPICEEARGRLEAMRN